MMTDEQYEQAAESSRIEKLTTPWATAARYEPSTGLITVELNRGFSVSFHKTRSQALHEATDEQLSEVEIFVPGFTVYFPKLDDGFTIQGMLAGRFGTRRWEREWADAHGIQIAENATAEHAVAA